MQVNKIDVDDISAELQQDAEDLLTESELIPRLEKHGVVTTVGSYRHHLMTVPDIDIDVIDPLAGRDQAKGILCDLIDQGFWRGFSLEDFVQFPFDCFPCGIYIGLKRTFRDRLWKVDIWNLVDIPPPVLSLDAAMSQATRAQRTLIIEIKRWRDCCAPRFLQNPSVTPS